MESDADDPLNLEKIGNPDTSLKNDDLRMEDQLEPIHGAMTQVNRRKELRARTVYMPEGPETGGSWLKFILILGAAIAVLFILGYGHDAGWFR